MAREFPEATKEFCVWIDEYKDNSAWHISFKFLKYKDLPGEMQYGIFLCYVNNLINEGKITPLNLRFVPSEENVMQWNFIPRYVLSTREEMLKPPSKIIT